MANISKVILSDNPYSQYISVLWAVLCLLVFMLPVFLHVDEIHQLTLHLYQRTHMNPCTYWIAAYLSDYAVAWLPISLATAVIFSFGYFGIGCLLAFWISILTITYGFLSQAYVISCIFKRSVFTIILLLVFNLIFFGICVFVVYAASMKFPELKTPLEVSICQK